MDKVEELINEVNKTNFNIFISGEYDWDMLTLDELSECCALINQIKECNFDEDCSLNKYGFNFDNTLSELRHIFQEMDVLFLNKENRYNEKYFLKYGIVYDHNKYDRETVHDIFFNIGTYEYLIGYEVLQSVNLLDIIKKQYNRDFDVSLFMDKQIFNDLFSIYCKILCDIQEKGDIDDFLIESRIVYYINNMDEIE